MTADQQIAIAGTTVVLFALPGYIGLTNQHLGAFALYAIVAGFSLAIIDRATLTWMSDEPAKAMALQAMWRILTVAWWGGIAYSLMIILF